MSRSNKADLELGRRQGALTAAAALGASTLKLLLSALDARAGAVTGERSKPCNR